MFLRMEDITPELIEKIGRLNNVADERGQTLAEMSLSWLLNKNILTSLIIGASSKQQLSDNIKAVDNMDFSIGELQEIENIINHE